MNPLPLGTHYHQRGLDEINRANTLDDLVRRQQKQVSDGVWRPVVAFLAFMGWLMWLLWAVAR